MSLRTTAAAAAVAAAIAALPAARVGAQTPTSPAGAQAPATATPKPTPRFADGKPDFSGYWRTDRTMKPGGNIGKDLPGFKLPFTPAGEAALKFNYTKTKDPESLCMIGGMPRHLASGLAFEVVQGRQKITFLYWYTYFRLTSIGDDLKHTEDPDPAFFGESIGKWEGDTLVIDSIAFKGDNTWIDENANPISDQLTLVERWSRPDFDHLKVVATITDPKYYREPFTYTRTWLAGTASDQLKEYSCSENNKFANELGYGPGPIRPDGTRGYIDAAPLPPPLPVKKPAPPTKKGRV